MLLRGPCEAFEYFNSSLRTGTLCSIWIHQYCTEGPTVGGTLWSICSEYFKRPFRLNFMQHLNPSIPYERSYCWKNLLERLQWVLQLVVCRNLVEHPMWTLQYSVLQYLKSCYWRNLVEHLTEILQYSASDWNTSILSTSISEVLLSVQRCGESDFNTSILSTSVTEVLLLEAPDGESEYFDTKVGPVLGGFLCWASLAGWCEGKLSQSGSMAVFVLVCSLARFVKDVKSQASDLYISQFGCVVSVHLTIVTVRGAKKLTSVSSAKVVVHWWSEQRLRTGPGTEWWCWKQLLHVSACRGQRGSTADKMT